MYLEFISKQIFFQSSFRFIAKLSRQYGISMHFHTCKPPSLPTSSKREVHCYNIVSSLKIYIRVYKNIMVYIYHQNIMHSSSLALKIFCVLPFHPSFSSPRTFYCLHSFAFSILLYHYTHKVDNLFTLDSFSQ